MNVALPPVFVDFVNRLLAFRPIQVVNDDGRAFLREAQSGAFTDAGTRTRDQAYFSVQPHNRYSHPLVYYIKLTLLYKTNISSRICAGQRKKKNPLSRARGGEKRVLNRT
ncbi:hypothetical protein OMP38_13160 [Cohnella ginsengisoli]|uniref:Uncharacterized protein n=1 Tax=Cohnella ginsengisoli TaxID=425004 RepID=A0A9X4KGW0_9BACL|nr:hypothetical protein [Cohnella ginsengisoli]MDG0791711.1 hypothetical protein [Cohnella ginsengisoli]